ncbi:MAG: O-antigen ligase family protein [Gammaproteobacteria bacterium]|nr:O-antigen ligase family protein [Gammaproteobacteria bacterium]
MIFNLSRDEVLQRVIYLLVFLFPVAAMSIRGWNAYIFSTFVIFGLLTIKRAKFPLYREEKVLLYLFFVGFVIFVISSLVNGWGREATKALGLEMMFLLFIPLYLLMRRFDESGKWLLRGVIVGAIVLGLQSGYEMEYLHRHRGEGAYSPIIYGSFAVLYAFLITGTLNLGSQRILYWLTILLSIGMALYAAAFAGSRGAYVAIPILLITLIFARYRDWRGGVILGAGLALVVVAYLSVPYVTTRVDQAVSNTTKYFTESNNVNSVAGRTSAGQRFEMWKAAWLIFTDNPMFGVGRGHYPDATKVYIEKGMVNQAITNHGHPHNMYLDFLASNGIGGFVVVVAILLYPALIFYRKRTLYKDSSTAGLLFITAYAVFSMFEASTFTKVNFLTTFLVFLAVFFSWHVREINKPESSDKNIDDVATG